MSKSIEDELNCDPIDIGEELRAKSLDTLNYLIQAVHNCKITEEQFNTGVDVLFMAVSGLVKEPQEPSSLAALAGRTPVPRFIDIITSCQNEIEHVYPVLKRILFNFLDGSFKVFQWQAGDAFVTCTTCVKGASEATKSRIDFDNPVKAKSALDRVASADALMKFGYVEVK